MGAYRNPAPTSSSTDREPLSELVARVDLSVLVERYAGHGKRVGGNWVFKCPNPSHDDGTPSFTVFTGRDGKQRARCWSECNWTGDALDLVVWLDRLDPTEAADRLRQLTGAPDPNWDRQARRTPPPKAPSRPAPPADPGAGWSPFPDPVKASTIMSTYLDGRGWPAAVVDRFDLTVVLDNGRRARIRHPFHAWDGSDWTVCGWQDRATTPGATVRWLTPAGATLPPFNARSLDRFGLVGVVATEGPADCITAVVALGDDAGRVAVIGIPGAKGWRPEWAELLAGHRVVIAADPDGAGQQLVDAIVADHRGPVVVLRLEHGDLTDTARAIGLDAVRELLLGCFPTGTPPTTGQPAPTALEHHARPVVADIQPADGSDGDPADDGGPGSLHDANPDPDPVAVDPDGEPEPVPEPEPLPIAAQAVDPFAGLSVERWEAWLALEHLGPNRWWCCDTCAEPALTSRGKGCYMTPGCSGKFLIRFDRDLLRPAQLTGAA